MSVILILGLSIIKLGWIENSFIGGIMKSNLIVPAALGFCAFAMALSAFA